MLQFRMAADRFAELLRSSLQESFTVCESMCIQQWEDAEMLESVLGVGSLLQYQSFWFV